MLSTGLPQPDAAVRTTIHFHDVEPGSHAAEAAALLQQAWSPPCVRYSDSYLRWQMLCPGPVTPRAIAASAGDRMIGFVALMPRQVSTPNGPGVVYVRSFLAVHPDYRGARIATELLARITARSDRPIVCFTRPGSHSEQTSLRSADGRGWVCRRLATLRTYLGGMDPRPDVPAVARMATVDEFLAATQQREPAAIVWSQPTPEQAAHRLLDPRGCWLVIVHGMNGVTLGAAVIVRSELLTVDGAETVPSLDTVYLHDHHAAALCALRRFALEHGRPSLMVSAPNLDVVPAAAIREAGFRATRSAFNVSILADPAELIARGVVSTNLEVF